MHKRADWSDGNYMEWADQERLVRQELNEIKQRRKEEAMAIKCEIEERLAVLSEVDNRGYQKELNLVSWNDRKPKFDIRGWNADHTDMTKGIALSKEEMMNLVQSVQKYMG